MRSKIDFLTITRIKSCINKFNLERYCIRVTSSNDESLCQNVIPNGPNSWAGSDIVIKHNGVNVATMPAASTEFEYCLDDIDIAVDELQLQSSSEDGVCITSLSINSNQLFVGKNNNLTSFWIDGNDQYCLDDFMSTSQITLQNEQVISSICKQNGKSRTSFMNPEQTVCMVNKKFAKFFDQWPSLLS